jgi:lysophospholipid acyltransferase (LPLAT)-like uncharacterized protein
MPLAPLARAIGVAMSWYVRLVAATSPVRGAIGREQVVLAFWHEFNLATVVVALAQRGDLPHASFSTRGFRGIVISVMLERLNVRVVPLPPEASDRAESLALAVRMARLARGGSSLVVTPDGPFGPYRSAKPGALIVARASGLPILPIAVEARPSLRLRRWDRHVLPLPFSRLRVRTGPPIGVGKRQAIGPLLSVLEERLDQVSGSPAG